MLLANCIALDCFFNLCATRFCTTSLAETGTSAVLAVAIALVSGVDSGNFAGVAAVAGSLIDCLAFFAFVGMDSVAGIYSK